MGVPGLWDVLKPAGSTRSLSHLAVVDGFDANKGGKRGYRIGIDASIWFFHARSGKDGENPELRTLFFRCATLLKAPFLPLFVFDGPLRPAIKRGKRINGESTSPLTNGMKALVEAFGYEWRVAPGEAEAELAYLNRIGIIDGILSDDVDTFLFGATTVIRNPSNNLSANVARPVLNGAGKDDKNHSLIFTAESLSSHVGLSQPDFILIALLSGGDYNAGIDGCGIKLSAGLAKCGFGKSLYNAAKTKDKAELRQFLVQWREDVKQELRTNQNKHLPRKSPSIASKFTDEFPDLEVLMQYVRPVVSSEFPEKALHAKTVTWEKDPDLGLIAQCCEQYFEWGYKEKIVKRFRTVIWPGAALRVLRAAVASRQPTGLAAITLTGEQEADDVLLTKIHSTRQHAITDNLLEYRVEVNPVHFIGLAESGVRGTRRPEDEDNWKGAVPEYMREEEETFDLDSDGEGKKGTKGDKTPTDPTSCLRIWLPASMVKAAAPSLIQPYEEKVAKRAKSKSKKKKITSEDETLGQDPQPTMPSAPSILGAKKATKPAAKSAKSKGKGRSATMTNLYEESSSSSSKILEAISEIPSTPTSSWRRTMTDPTPARATVQPFPMSREDFFSQSTIPDDDDSDWEINPSSVRKLPAKGVAQALKPSLNAMVVEDSDWDLDPSSNPTTVPMDISPAPKVKTTTKIVSASRAMGLKGYFGTSKPGKQVVTEKGEETGSKVLRSLRLSEQKDEPFTMNASKDNNIPKLSSSLTVQPFPMSSDDFFSSSSRRAPFTPTPKRIPRPVISDSSSDIEFGSPHEIVRKSPKKNKKQISPKNVTGSLQSPSPRTWSRTTSAPSALHIGNKPRTKAIPQDIIELSDSDDDNPPPLSKPKSRAASAGPTIQAKLTFRTTATNRLPTFSEDADVIDLT